MSYRIFCSTSVPPLLPAVSFVYKIRHSTRWRWIIGLLLSRQIKEGKGRKQEFGLIIVKRPDESLWSAVQAFLRPCTVCYPLNKATDHQINKAYDVRSKCWTARTHARARTHTHTHTHTHTWNKIHCRNLLPNDGIIKVPWIISRYICWSAPSACRFCAACHVVPSSLCNIICVMHFACFQTIVTGCLHCDVWAGNTHVAFCREEQVEDRKREVIKYVLREKK
jgi:hypothetical protein